MIMVYNEDDPNLNFIFSQFKKAAKELYKITSLYYIKISDEPLFNKVNHYLYAPTIFTSIVFKKGSLKYFMENIGEDLSYSAIVRHYYDGIKSLI